MSIHSNPRPPPPVPVRRAGPARREQHRVPESERHGHRGLGRLRGALDSTRLDSTRLDSTRLDSARLDSTGPLSARPPRSRLTSSRSPLSQAETGHPWPCTRSARRTSKGRKAVAVQCSQTQFSRVRVVRSLASPSAKWPLCQTRTR